MRRPAIAAVTAGGLLVAVCGYGALNAYAGAPGPLTTAGAARPAVPQPGASTVGPKVAAPAAPLIPAGIAIADGSVALPAKVAARISTALHSSVLTGTTAFEVRDALTGSVLFTQDQNKALTPASTTKLLTAWAIANTMDLAKPLVTKVVAGGGNSIILVAGGDTALNPGKGDPDAVNGHAGLADLAAQVAANLKRQGRTSVSLDVDTSYAPGPLTAAHWTAQEVALGYTARIAMLGLSTQRATDPARPTPADPVASTKAAFAKDLQAQGVSVVSGSSVKAESGAAQLGAVYSSPLVDVLGDALQQSDNAMIESLARQAAFVHGIGGSTADVAGFVERTLAAGGFDLSGVKLQDVCGLSEGTTVPARLLSDVLVSGTTGKNKPFAQVLSRLSVGGYNGTLDNRFQASTNESAAGDVRAKTGSLLGVAALAGTVIDADDRVLVFALINNGPESQGSYATRAALDNIIAALQGCGCS
ncbi:D-alanyl-D-alanine carboxypeptidase/D-alanyl-D-alanine-endopeptidase [Rudaeicoccus suwonensis]|uniref:D-alanyl-D-alanine carboxypeptidase/D-alanyl-D-alanine-endopeptidase (Penicillin-binding protein 4) n=1 Tax=Rudaeicoccus suwonensis TaxID=657409 RepID=A0A561E2W4_9MICO|nr:D-alanyl-D-alanine carboxypeptidase [Rudaeicoccus suwonensis]TWE09957.1 D-alanyl-D-alanine carboxypeptidase/D-alanyl-D-alanine-endopeptidase (penicillin-binding protein 4) [Rudaeicoccus suwonensis]